MLLFVILYFVLSIVIFVANLVYIFLKKKYYKNRFEKAQKKKIAQLETHTAQTNKEIAEIEAELEDLIKTGYYFHSTKQERVKMLQERLDTLKKVVKPFKERMENLAKDKFLMMSKARAERRDQWLEAGISLKKVNEMDQEFD